jgi:myo-inositol-1(or 4)-monophosphatase
MTDTPSMHPDLQGIVKAVQDQYRHITQAYAQSKIHSTEKSPFDYVTELDVTIEKALKATIHATFPDHNIHGEETDYADNKSAYTWYIDPIDGTRNFIHQRPDVAISVALYEGETGIMGCVALPTRQTIISAHHEQAGIFVNDTWQAQPTAPPASLDRAYIGIPGDTRKNNQGENLLAMWQQLHAHVEGFRISGALAYDLGTMVLGELSARLSRNMKAVDVAAGVFLLRHTGGKVTDMQGDDLRLASSQSILAASSATLHEALLRLVG